MKDRTHTSTLVALGVLAGGLLAVASVQAQQGSAANAPERLTTQQRTQTQLRNDQLSPEALQRERVRTETQSRQRLQPGADPVGAAPKSQYQYQNQNRHQYQYQQPGAVQGFGSPSGGGGGSRMGGFGGGGGGGR